MKSLNYVQSHTLTDIRLALGYTAVLAVAVAAYYEYKLGFQQAKSWSMLSVGTYFILNGALYIWTTYVESDTVYVGKKGDTWVQHPCMYSLILQVEITTSVKKYEPTYNVVFRAYKKSDITNVANVTTKMGFNAWFDVEGTFVKKPFDNWLGDNVISVEKQLAAGKSKKKR